MYEIVASIAIVQIVIASAVVIGVLYFRSDIAMLIGSILLIAIACGFLFTANSLEAVLLYGTIPPDVVSKQPSVEVQRLRIALWNLIVSFVVGGVGVSLLSTFVSNYVSKKSTPLSSDN